jgi:sugar lactone lactonase YvrE
MLETRRTVVFSILLLAAGCGGGSGSKESTSSPEAPKENPPVISVVAGDAVESGSADGAARTARFNGPAGIAVDDAGNLYVADEFNRTIRKITPSGQVSTLAGVVGQAGSENGLGGAARFTFPVGLAIDAKGNLFVADGLAIRQVTSSGQVTTVATIPLGANIDSRSIQLFTAQGVAVAANGDLYATTGIGTRRITPQRTTIIEGVDTLNDVFGSRSPPPRGVTVDSSGTVYVADLRNAISKLGSNNSLVPVAGAPGSRGSADGAGSAASFDSVTALSADSPGNVYAADQNNSLIRKITPAGVVTTVAGTRGSNRLQTGALPGSLARVTGIAFDKNTGIIYATSGNAVIRIGPG